MRLLVQDLSGDIARIVLDKRVEGKRVKILGEVNFPGRIVAHLSSGKACCHPVLSDFDLGWKCCDICGKVGSREEMNIVPEYSRICPICR